MLLTKSNRQIVVILMLLFLTLSSLSIQAQWDEDEDYEFIDKEQKVKLDSIYIAQVENRLYKPKVLHAEPLYIDLIRDLGARKGEAEWNVGLGLTDNNTFDRYAAFIEYEFAPINRLGLEIESTFEFYYPNEDGQPTPGSRMSSLKLAAQHSFWVSDKYKTSMAWGYLNELEFIPFREYGDKRFTEANVYNPFFVAAKRWGKNFHTLLLGGPEVYHEFATGNVETNWSINTNIHYMIPGTRNFIGLEFNKDIQPNSFGMTIRPQMRVSVTDDLLIGIVAGIPANREKERFSSFIRLIYEPPHKPKRAL